MAKRSELACCYHPSTVLWLDDERTFLSSVNLELDEFLPCLSYDEPHDALSYLQENDMASSVFDKYLSNLTDLDDDVIAENSVNIDLQAIHREIYNPHRFERISVIIVDYAMPSMTGVEFCQQLKDLPVKRIMVTGEADYRTAVNAFNEGLIDKFIMKDDENFMETVNQSIVDLQQRYFIDLSEVITRNLLASGETLLNNKLFQTFFQKFCSDNQIVEYYLSDKLGSFTLLDAHGNVSFFVVKSESELDDYYNNLLESDQVPTDLMQQLQARSHIPFFFSEENLQTPVESWNEFMYPATVIEDCAGYYYSHVQDLTHYDIDKSNILSFDGYLNQL